MSEEAKTREDLLKQAEAMQLADLAKMVVNGSYTPGVHDVVLISACEKIDNFNNGVS